MEYKVDKPLRDFEFWCGAVPRAEKCTPDELDELESFFEETAPEDGWTDTGINDMFWFEFDNLALYLGYENEEDFDLKHDPKYVDDDELAEYAGVWFRGFVTEHLDDYPMLEEIAYQLGFGQTEEEWVKYEQEESAVANYLLRCYEENDFCLMEYLFDDVDSGHDINNLIPTTAELREWAMQEKADKI